MHIIHASKGSDDLSYNFKLCDVANENCLFIYCAFGKYYLCIEGRESGDKQDFERLQKKKKELNYGIRHVTVLFPW